MVDFNLDNGNPVKNVDIELILQQIDILFDTNPKEIIGFPDYGSKYDNYLYNLRISNESLKNIVMNDLNSLELFGFTPHVEVYLLQGSEKDIALIEIVLTRDDEIYERIYNIS